MVADPTVTHGLAATYSYRLCRCQPCADAWHEQTRQYRAAAKARTAQAGGVSPDALRHGAATYKNRGCRCPACTLAASRYERGRNPRQRATKHPEPVI